MSELIRIIYDYLLRELGAPDGDGYALEIAQGIAEAIVAAGWPRQP